MSRQTLHKTGQALLTLAVLFGGAGLMNVRSEAAVTLKARPTASALKARATAVQEKRARRITQEQREAAAERAKALRSKTTRQRKAGTPGGLAGSIRTMTDMTGMPGPGDTPRYFGPEPNWAFSPELRKFVDTLPGLGSENPNNLGQYLPVAVADKTTYPGSDYYEIAVVQYQEKMHTDLDPTTLRGYVQINTPVVDAAVPYPLTYPDGTAILDGSNAQVYAVDKPHYLGPVILAEKDRPVRIKFTNYLPTGTGGNLFIPVDTTVMGAGMGPIEMPDMPGHHYSYTQNRATIHLHGGRTPWISDGTPHQWITPAGEDTPYKKGDSAQNVPDMPDPGPGSQTYYYTNQQSARLMFYHDHSYGITRLNVYAGEAAGYMITDSMEQELVDTGTIPAEQIPLIIQDKTFVDPTTVLDTDPTWSWGSMPSMPMKGDLWLPHVYMPAQNPYDIEGMSAVGRWHYGPWFWPPTENITHGPIPNPYADPNNPLYSDAEPAEIPGVPHPSMGMESFFDTPVVNGTAFPTLTVEPRPYRFRILNAANDRFFNLQLYKADPDASSIDGRALTEVKMVPAAPDTGLPENWPTDGREGGVPDPAPELAGPDWIQIGTEGGFLPAPVVIPAQPITWNLDPTTFNFGNVQDHSLLLGPAERADVIVDFSQYPGQTFILYNDAPTAFPALDPRTDYYTGAPDMTDTGGHWGPQAGFGPNTRTVMQIKVNLGTPSLPFDMVKLNAAFVPADGTAGVFARGQDPVIVGQSAYNSTYNKAFPTTRPEWGYSGIHDTSLTFRTVTTETKMTIPMQPKAIQDEMGEAFDKEYGRMSGFLGVELPFTNSFNQTFVLQAYMDPATERVTASAQVSEPLLGDGTQIWKITHNGVDTHPIHFHLFDVQLINRVGWDGAIRVPDANELGWKDTVRVSPLEDTIVALRPVAPKQPFGIPDSVRLLDPTMPAGSTMGFTNIDPITGQPMNPPTVNQLFNFGWEYMWHCHILSHEEMDMMRPIVFNVPRQLPAAFGSNYQPVTTGNTGNEVTWKDPTPITVSSTLGNPANEIGYRIERAVVGKNGKPGPYTVLGTSLANTEIFLDNSASPTTLYSYRVVAYNAAGETASTANVVVLAPLAPTNLVASTIAGPQIRLTWMDNATNETGFIVEKDVNGGGFTYLANVGLRSSTGSVTFTDPAVTPGNNYTYRVKAVNTGGESVYATATLVEVIPLPSAPTGLTVTAVVAGKRATATLNWTDLATNETSYTVQRATNNLFTSGLSSTTLAANSITATHTGLTRNTWYYFRVRANNASGPSAWTQTVALLTP